MFLFVEQLKFSVFEVTNYNVVITKIKINSNILSLSHFTMEDEPQENHKYNN